MNDLDPAIALERKVEDVSIRRMRRSERGIVGF
jgi:hypothetical protein